jgi:hypothetical protein
LNDEIVSLLWLKYSDILKPEIAFSQFLKILRWTGFNLNDLTSYLSLDDNTSLLKQTVRFLETEDDLKNGDNEIKKVWYDSERFTHQPISSNIPEIKFLGETTYEMIQNLKTDRNFYQFENYAMTQEVRSSCVQLLSFILVNELHNEYSFGIPETVKILNDISRPCLIFNLLFLIKRVFPEAIPYIIMDIKLIPLALDLLDEIELNEKYYPSINFNDNKYEKESKLKNDFYFEAIEICIQNLVELYKNNKTLTEKIAKAIDNIFLLQSRYIFQLYSMSHPHGIINLNNYFNRYQYSLKYLTSTKINIGRYNGISKYDYLILKLVPYSLRHLINLINDFKIHQNDTLMFNFEHFDVSIDFIRTSNALYNSELSIEDQKQLSNVSYDIICLLKDKLYSYFDIKADITDESRIFMLWVGFPLERIDVIEWGYFFILLMQYRLLAQTIDDFKSTIKINVNENEFSIINKIQKEKIQRILRICLMAYLSLKKDRMDIYKNESLLNKIFDIIENFIIDLSLMYSKNNCSKGYIDVFDCFIYSERNSRYDTLIVLLFKSVSYMSSEQQGKFISRFFDDSIKLDRMLIAFNLLNDENSKKIVTKYVSNINIDAFIASCFMITDVEEALFEALRSEEHWKIGYELIKKIKGHYSQRKINDDRIYELLYQADLILAYHNSDTNQINAVDTINENSHIYDKRYLALKQYYIALNLLDHEKKYEQSSLILKGLASDNSNDVRYNLTYVRSRMFEGLYNSDNKLIMSCYQEWETFLKLLGDKKDQFLSLNQDVVNYSLMPYYITFNKYDEFDHAIKCMSDDQLYEEIFIQPIFYLYRERNLSINAYNYINGANTYYISKNRKNLRFIEDIISAPDKKILSEKKQNFENIIATYYKHIPNIIPDIINDKTELDYFILNEIIQALHQMQEKINALNKLKTEDDYTDVLQSILALRFPFYGWHIQDNSHMGKSEAGKCPGEPDLIIKSGNHTIAIAEAFKLKGKDTNVTKNHILKCFNYSKTLKRYFIIIYYLGNPKNFHSTWKSYKEIYRSISFPDGYNLVDTNNPFIQVNEQFDNSRDFNIASTKHADDFEFYHVMVNFAE